MDHGKSGFLGNLQARLQQSFNKPANWYIEIAGYLIAGFIVWFFNKTWRPFFLLALTWSCSRFVGIGVTPCHIYRLQHGESFIRLIG